MCGLINILSAQVERIYDDEGHLRTIKPINDAGRYEGVAISYYPDGMIEQEVPYEDGLIHGVMRRYWPDGELSKEVHYQAGEQEGLERSYHPNGTLEMERNWVAGHLQGRMTVQDTLQRMRLLIWMQTDSVVFAQRFGPEGRLTHEKIGRWDDFRLDSSTLSPVRVFAQEELPLQAGRWHALQAFLPGVPLALTQVNCEGCQDFEARQGLPYPLHLLPAEGQQSLTLYLGIRLRPGAAPVLMRSVTVPIASP